MATTNPQVEFHTLTLKQDDTSLPSALTEHLTKLKTDNSIRSIHRGKQIEHPTRWSVIIVTTTPGRDAASSWAATLGNTLLDSRSIVITAPGVRGNLAAALDAPCTEVFTCHGVDDGFLDANMKPFAEGVDKGRPDGFHGLAYGEFDQPADGDLAAGPAVRILLGWDSKEAHLAQRGEGKGRPNIDLAVSWREMAGKTWG